MVQKKTFETISFKHRIGLEDVLDREELIQQAIVKMRDVSNGKIIPDE